ncbi:MAG: aldolase [Sphingomonas sp.]|uniref:HpcH/HpaI aldolase family protein n=1 Tax=Sphingomonas sp. TaxID=28214 RepID=UPI0025D56A7A|nr:aldolase/citrate lyase family protein [Sphingomonas sp.]MBQ1497301.1 aldolase [Sphingomonas sp.]
MKNERLKAKLAAGETAIGSWLTLPSVAIAEILALAGFDWLVVDLEHSVTSIDVAGDMIRVIDLCGVSPLVRLTSNDPDQIKRVMDAGAHGIVVPMVTNAEEARQAVAATRYAPAGIRGVGLARAQGYGATFRDYLDWQARGGPIVIAQIEHIDAVDALEEILAVDGIDAFIIGPYDLSASMGLPGQFDHPDFVAAMARIAATATRLGKTSGLHVVEPGAEGLRKAHAAGHRFIAYSVDIRMLDVAARFGTSLIEELDK